jgi:hypothetical protein
MIFLPPTPPPGPVHVIVDHVATTPGLPLWATTLISAGIGAAFGMFTNSLMELLRPRLDKWITKRGIFSELGEEMVWNMGVIEGKLNFVNELMGDRGDQRPREYFYAIDRLKSDVSLRRYDAFRERKESLLFGIVENKELDEIYVEIEKYFPNRVVAPDKDDDTLYGPVRADVPGDLDSLSGDLEFLLEDGMEWLNGHGFKRAYARHRKGIENEALSWRRNRTFSALPKLDNLNKKEEG